MLFLHKSTPSQLIDRIAQYNYRSIHTQFKSVARVKCQARINSLYNDPRLKKKVKFNYRKIDLSGTPIIWAKIWNLLSLKNKKCKAPNHCHADQFITSKTHMLDTLAEYNIHNVHEKLIYCLNHELNQEMNNEFHTIHNLLLSFI